MRKILILFAIFALSISAFAVFETRFNDAACAAFGDIPPEIGNSPSSLFGENGTNVGGGYKLNMGYDDFAEMSAYFNTDHDKFGRFGLMVSDFGVEDLTHETKIGLSYTRCVIKDVQSQVKIALRGDIYSLSYEPSAGGTDLGSQVKAGLTFAIETKVFDRTRLAILAENITATDMGVDDGIEIPRAVTGLLGYTPYLNTDMTFFARREAGHEFEYAVAASARPIEFISFRAGVITNPDRVTGGIGIHYDMFTLDYAVQSHSTMPLSHVVSLNINVFK